MTAADPAPPSSSPRRPNDPDGRLLRKAARTSIVMTASFLIGEYVVGSTQFAVMATFTGTALLGIADFAGERRGRLRASVSTLAAGAALLALGTAVSSSTAVATVTMFVVTLVVGYTAVFSGYFAAASSAVVVFYVVATGFPGPVSTIPAREAGLLFGGGLSVVAAGWLWPSSAASQSRRALAAAYRQLGRAVAELADGEPRSVAPSASDAARPLDAAVLAAEEAVARSAWRPDGLARPQKARLYLLQGARRMAEVVGLLHGLPRYRGVPGEAHAKRLEGALAESLEECAVALEGGPVPDPGPVEEAARRFAAEARERLEQPGPPGGATRHAMATETFLLHHLAWGVALAVLHARAMLGAPAGGPRTAGSPLLADVLFDGPSARKWARRARRNLTPRSVHLQNSLRLATGLALARLAVGLLDLSHGFWVGFATLVVLKTSAAGTRSTAVQAAAGTTIGFVASTLFIAAVGVDDTAYAAALPVVTFAAFYLPGTVSFAAGQACFTVVIVLLFNLVKPAGWTVGLLRLEDVLIGAGVGIAVGVAMWPRGAVTELRRTVGRLFGAGGSLAGTTVAAMAGPSAERQSPDVVPADLVRRIRAAAVDVEDVFSQYLSEPHQSHSPVMEWARVVADAHRLWFGAATASVAPRLVSGRLPPSGRSLVEQAGAVLEEDYRRVDLWLTEGSSLKLDPLPRLVYGDTAPRGAGGEGDRATLRLLEIETWIDELAAGPDELGPLVTQLGESEKAAAMVPAATAG